MLIDPLHTLQAAARAYGKHVVPGVQIERVIVIAAGGVKIASVAVPLCGESSPPVAPLVDGWDFSEPMPRFDGVLVPIAGQKLKLLRVLAEAPGPLKIDALRAAWPDDVTESGEHLTSEGTIRWSVAKLKELLRKQFPQVAEPIANGPEGYSLALR